MEILYCKEIPKQPGCFICTNGWVYKNGKFLKPYNDRYSLLCIMNKGHKKCYSIHRLVAEAFIPNPNNLPCVNHKNENKLDNRVENLEWCTHKYNSNYGTSPKRIAEKRSKKVNQYTLDGTLVKTWGSCHEIERETGFKFRCISKVCTHKQKTAYGYKWEYPNV